MCDTAVLVVGTLKYFYLLFSFPEANGIFVPHPRIESMSPALEVDSDPLDREENPKVRLSNLSDPLPSDGLDFKTSL